MIHPLKQSGNTALHMAAYRGRATVLRYLLADAFLDTSLRNNVSDAAYRFNLESSAMPVVIATREA